MKVNVPLFPNFSILSLDHKHEIQAITSKFPPHSDFNFVSLWAYNTENDLEVSILENNLIIKFRDYLTNEPFFSFLGNTNVLHTVRTLLDYSRQKNIQPILKMVPEDSLPTDERILSNYTVVEDRDNFDYVLSVEDILNLEGEKYHHHRNQINKFRKTYPNHKTRHIDLNDPLVKADLLSLFDRWIVTKGVKEADSSHELTAIIRILDHQDYLSLLGLGLYVEGRLVSFVICDIGHPTHAQTHFFKSDRDFEGTYSLLRQELARELSERNLEYLNIEQDLGIPGLRFAKGQWNPEYYLKKYTIADSPSFIDKNYS